jgi:cytochrome P450
MSSSFLLALLSGGIQDPYPHYAAIHRAGGIVRDKGGVLLVARYRDVAEILASPRFAFLSERMFGSMPESKAALAAAGFFSTPMFLAGPAHRSSRLSLAPLFAGPQLNRIRMRLEARAAGLLRPRANGAEFDLIASVVADIAVGTLAELLGVTETSVRDCIARSRQIAALLAAAPLPPPAVVAAATEFAAMTACVDRLVSAAETAREHPHPISAALATLAAPKDRRRFMADLVTLLLTGYDTSVATLGNAVAALALHAPARNALLADPSLLTHAADELIRFDVAGQVVFRHALEPTRIGSCPIETGATIALLVGGANRDPAEFDSPDMLDLKRERGRPLSFGMGPHACIGAALARLQLNILLHALLPFLPKLSLVQPHAGAAQHGLIRHHRRLLVRIGAPVGLPAPQAATSPEASIPMQGICHGKVAASGAR